MWNPPSSPNQDTNLPPDLLSLLESIAEHVHNVWARQRTDEGWRTGPTVNSHLKETPLLVPYAQLPELEKKYDRNMAVETLKFMLRRGYTITPPEQPDAFLSYSHNDREPVESIQNTNLPHDLLPLLEDIAEQVHNVWARQRIGEGWRYGLTVNSLQKTTPLLVPYSQLTEAEKEYDRNTATEALSFMLSRGYTITPPEQPDIFLSYSHDDRELVEAVAAELKERGYSCWIDAERLRAMETIHDDIDRAIRDRTTLFIAFLSSSYITKPYCLHEFDLALTYPAKSIISVVLDNVNPVSNRSAAYMFNFSAGGEHIGEGGGLPLREHVQYIADQLCQHTCFNQYSLWKKDPTRLPPPTASPEYILANLMRYHETQYDQSGNYGLGPIDKTLFPAVMTTDGDKPYRREASDKVTLLDMDPRTGEDPLQGKHLLLLGDGGMGKTLSLLETTRYLLSQKLPAIYVPLCKLKECYPLEKYLEERVCKGNQLMLKELMSIMSVSCRTLPSIILILDGINELPLDYCRTFINSVLSDNYIRAKPGVRLILSSRWSDSSLMRPLLPHVTQLELQPLSREAINQYLEARGLPPVENPKILSVIQTPLMLTLYACCRATSLPENLAYFTYEVQALDPIRSNDILDTRGKIMASFFRSQLYRAEKEDEFPFNLHLILLEYLLPDLGYAMVRKNAFYLTEDELWNRIALIRDNCTRYQWFDWDYMCRRNLKLHQDEISDLAFHALRSLHFLCNTDMGYTFLHQDFRDYFAACHIANDIKALKHKPSRLEECPSVLENQVFSEDILSFVADILHEDAARPVFAEDGWHYPQPTGAESCVSLAQDLLKLWRQRSDDGAQIAVANLFTIMKLGRDGLLSNCDFSGLDLRRCQLNQCRFTEWYRDRYYPSSFDGAWIDRSNFLTDGHDAAITALAAAGRYIISGDQMGHLKRYDLTAEAWDGHLQLHTEPVIDLAVDDSAGRLAVLYRNRLFLCDLLTGHVLSQAENTNGNDSFRYAGFAPDGQPLVSFAMEPLLWCRPDGTRLPSDLPFDIPVRCAVWHPSQPECIRSYPGHSLSVMQYDRSTDVWVSHPALPSQFCVDMYPDNETPIRLLNLQDFCPKSRGSVNSIQYSRDGSRFLVAGGDWLLEFDAEHLLLLNKLHFSVRVGFACYLPDGAAVAVGSDLILLDRDLNEITTLKGAPIQRVVYSSILEDHSGSGYYLYSNNGELKHLSRELVVQNIRNIDFQPPFTWARGAQGEEPIQMVFLYGDGGKGAVRYVYETDHSEPLGWRYRLMEPPHFMLDLGQRFYNVDTQMIALDCAPPYHKYCYSNYSGLHIFRCSFSGLKGTMSSPENLKILLQNGGVDNEQHQL